jgi:pyridoxal phosphate enzyme (YggS family)
VSVTTNSLEERWNRINERVKDAAQRVGRDPADITIMAVTKTVDRPVIDETIALGVWHIGENRVQEARRKLTEPPLGGNVSLHLIGQLQTNKARAAVQLFDLIESVDRLPLVEVLEREAEKQNRQLPILIHVNVSGERQKAGCDPDDVSTLVRRVRDAAPLELRGLMTIAPLVEEAESVRAVFRQLRCLQESMAANFPSMPLLELSMGMSNDMEVAIEEGATIVRVGRALFGERVTP